MTTATLSPSVHEAAIARHFKKDEDDAVLQALFESVKAAREACAKATATTDAVLQNELETLPARHRKARAATFALLENATKSLDAAVKQAQAEAAAITVKVKGPPAPKDQAGLSRQNVHAGRIEEDACRTPRRNHYRCNQDRR